MAKEKSWEKFMPAATIDICEENLNKFFYMVFERQQIWWKRNVLKLPAPWTKDKILRDYKFTNTYRFLDRSSDFLIRNIILDKSITNIYDLLFKMIIYRFYNKPETFTHPKLAIKISNYKDFDCNKLWEQTVKLRASGSDPFHSSYLMNPTNLTKEKAGWIDSEHKDSFRDHVYCKVVFQKVHDIIPALVKLVKNENPPQDIIDLLTQIPAVALFMATEFYLDLTYIPNYRDDFKFKWTPNDFCNVGPGCSTGIRMIFPSLPKKRQHEALIWLRDLAEEYLAKFGDMKYIKWDKKKNKYVRCSFNLDLNSGVEFSACEFSKYKKMEWGEGKQRMKFIPKS